MRGPQHLAAISLLLAIDASAGVLTEANETRLCTATYAGKPAIDPDELAFAIVSEAGATPFLDGANASGYRDRAIQLESADSAPSEPVYAILNFGTSLEAKANRPFGPDLDLASNEPAAKAREAIAMAIIGLQKLMEDRELRVSDKLVYRIEQRSGVGEPADLQSWRNPERIFGPDPFVIIVCDRSSAAPPPRDETQRAEAPTTKKTPADLIRLRGTVKDLTVAAKDLKDAKPLAISFVRDDKAETETLGFNGVLGVRFGDAARVFDFIPFVSYENQALNGSKGDVEKLSPGLLFGYRLERPDWALHARIEPNYLSDIRYDAEQVKVRAYLDPAFRLGSGRGVLFGSYLKGIGPLQWRPDLTLLADASHVLDRGGNPALTDASNYIGLGGQVTLRLRLDRAPFSDFTLDGGFRTLRLFGDIRNDDAHRWFGGLSYSPPNFPYVAFGLSFTSGENDDTFQDEERYSLDVKLRY